MKNSDAFSNLTSGHSPMWSLFRHGHSRTSWLTEEIERERKEKEEREKGKRKRRKEREEELERRRKEKELFSINLFPVSVSSFSFQSAFPCLDHL